VNSKLLFLFAPIVAFMACTQASPTQPTTSSNLLGKVELSFDPISNRSSAKVSTRAALPDNAAVFSSSSFGDFVFTPTNTRYLSATFNVTNNSGADFNNLTLYAYNQAGLSLGGTAIRNLVNFGGGAITAEAAAQSLLPTHAITQSSPGVLQVDTNRADFQAFKSSEVSGLQTQALALGVMQAGDSVLEYGFVARNATGGRVIPNGGTGTITLSYRVPESSFTNSSNPYRFVGDFLLANEPISRVTRGLDDTTAAANARAAAISASQVVLIGSDADTASTGTTTRLANARISVAPKYLLQPAGGATCPAPTSALTSIPSIQGTTPTSALVNSSVNFEGVVTGDFQGANKLSGFFVQDRNGDGNANTSDGILVYLPAFNALSSIDVFPGDYVQVTGTVKEFKSATTDPGTLTEIDTVTALTVCGSSPIPTPTTVTLDAATSQNLEPFEGMLVQFTQALTVSETFSLSRYGEMTLSAGGRLFNPTNNNRPGSAGALAAAAGNINRKILLDDGSTNTNLNPIPYLSAADTTGTRRIGDSTTGLTAIMSYGFNLFRLQPTTPPVFVADNPRSSSPNSVGGTLKVAAANVLNFFTNLDLNATIINSKGLSYQPRGAQSAAELTRQRNKTLSALSTMNADVFGLIEVENNGNGTGSALQNLVDGLNSIVGANIYAAIEDPALGVGTDAIHVAIIYKPASVTPLGAAVSDPAPIHNRPPVAQTFRTRTGSTFTVVVNHFKSKGCTGATGLDIDAGDGQGCFNDRRKQQATQVLSFIETLKTRASDTDVLVVGDLNAYGFEDPIDLLTNASNPLTSLNLQIPVADRYSYVFNGETGYLDHALSSASLTTQVTGVTEWHVNADEPITLDYNLDQGYAPNPPKADDRYAATQYRYSDHDPVLVGLNLTSDSNTTINAAPTLTLSGSSTATGGSIYTLNIAAVPAAGSSLTGITVNWGDGVTDNLAGSVSSATHTFSNGGTAAVDRYISVLVKDQNTENAAALKIVGVTPGGGSTTGRMVISQVYGGGGNSGAVSRSDFIELFNAGTASVSLSGWSLQYAGGTATTWITGNQTVLPSVSVAPGQYYLVKQADGANTAVPVLTTQDLTGTIALSSTSGKVALVNSTTLLTGANPVGGSSVIDFVGYGTVNGSETAAAPIASNITSVSRKSNGCTDSNNNSSDFTAGAPNPRNTITTLSVCP
jgi:uncharacterized protein